MSKSPKLLPPFIPAKFFAADTALRLARYFHTNPEFWLNLQNFYDLELTRRSGAFLEIDREVLPAALAS